MTWINATWTGLADVDESHVDKFADVDESHVDRFSDVDDRHGARAATWRAATSAPTHSAEPSFFFKLIINIKFIIVRYNDKFNNIINCLLLS
jgi:hypothetical protein